MELELKFAELACCEPVGDLVTTQEESMETAIPEYCPDIARIVDTVGQLRLREKHPAGQQLTMGGSVVLTVLYTSEESAGLRSLSMEVPFSCQVEDKRLADCDAVCVTGRLLLAEAKAVTARKLYLRVMPEFTVSGYARRRQRLCCGTEEDPALRVRRQEAELELLTAVEEREFSFAQEVAPDGPPPEDVLMERTAARVEECRRVGSSSEIRVLRTENGPAFGITVTICAALLVRRKQQVSYIEDLYSLHHAAQVRRQETPLPVAWQRDIPSQEAVQQLEFGQGRPFAYLTAAECSGVSTVQEGGGPALRCTVRLRVLYLDESGTPVCAERSAEVTAPAAWEPQTVRAACGLPQMQITGSTCRLSVPVRFEARRCLRRPVAAVTAVELQDPPEGPQPSLILRRMAEGETLWDIARQYRTDEEAIRAANELTEDRPEGMLLIPRVR